MRVAPRRATGPPAAAKMQSRLFRTSSWRIFLLGGLLWLLLAHRTPLLSSAQRICHENGRPRSATLFTMGQVLTQPGMPSTFSSNRRGGGSSRQVELSAESQPVSLRHLLASRSAVAPVFSALSRQALTHRF